MEISTPRSQSSQNQGLPLPQFQRVISTPKKDLSLWRLSREFDDTTDAYHYQQQQQQQQQQPPKEVQIYQQELQGQPALTQHTYQYPRSPFANNFNNNMAAAAPTQQQRETVPIGFDPGYGAQAGPEMVPEPTRYQQQDMPAEPTSPGVFAAPYGGGGAQDPLEAAQKQAKLPSSTITTTEVSEVPTYSPDWITAEAPNSITDGEFYDQDADGGAYYTYGAEQEQEQQQQQQSEESHEFEQPRQVPYDHRQTRVVLKEDVDFYMALLGGQDPAPASSGTQTLVQQEQEVRRRSQEVEVQQSTLRRQEELLDTQSDLDFWASLMEKA